MYNDNAQVYESQFVIKDSATAVTKTSGSLIVEGGTSSLDTYITGNANINEVKITPNLNDFIYEQQSILLSSNDEFLDITDFYFRNSVTRAFKSIIYVETLTMNSIWEINAVRNDNNVWSYQSSFTGDNIPNIDFIVINKNINEEESAQVQYKSNTKISIRYRAWTSSDIDVDPTNDIGIFTNTSGSFISNSLFYASSPNTVAYSKGLKYNLNTFTIEENSKTIMSNADSFTNFSNGGALTVMGNASISKNLIIGEKIGINNTNPSYDLDLNGTIRTNNISVTGSGTFGGHIIPDTDVAYDLGSSDNRWRDLYLSGDTIYLGDTEIKVTGGNISFGDSLEVNGELTITGNTYTENQALDYSYDHTWISRIEAATNNWMSVCWSPELGLFCAVSNNGDGNRVMTSPDGITWTTRNSPANIAWDSVCWAPELGLFCAVAASGTGNRVMTSTNGIDWTTRSSAADSTWFAICWAPELEIFCALGTNAVMTSPNGINWTLRSSPAVINWTSICWSPELRLFCAVATTTNSENNGRIMISSNGVDWTITASDPGSGISFRTVCWSPELGIFCALSVNTSTNIYTSNDGINWVINSTGSGKFLDYNSIIWSSELNLFFGVTSEGPSVTSPDGINWTVRSSASDNLWESVCWSPELGRLCAVSRFGSNNRVMTSDAIITSTGGKMSITQKGRRLGIGKYDPQVELDVKGTIRASNQILAPSGNGESGVAGISFYGDINTGLFRPAPDTIGILTDGIERMIITSSGNIGIGTSNPLYPLEVDLVGSLTDFSSGASILTSSGSTTTTSGHTITIAAKRSIWAKDGVLSSSDSRIKKDITDINDTEALEKIRVLEPKFYNYVDKYFKGDRTVIGFLAQQVSEHLPHAVSTQRDVIPNVYDIANVNIVTETITVEQETEEYTNETIIHKIILTLTSKTHDFIEGDIVRIYDNTNTPFDLKVISVVDNSSFTIEFNSVIFNKLSVFVYGKFVDDFHVLDKNYIWSIFTAALQEVDRELQAVKNEIVTETELITSLEQRIINLENQQ